MSVLAREPHSTRFDRYLIDSTLHKWELTPFRITVIYFLFGFAALYFSDIVLVRRFSDPLLSQLQALKGGAEIVFTGGLIYALTMTKEAQFERSRAKLDRQQEELLVLHRVLRHNLRNDLNIILGMSEALNGGNSPGGQRRRGDIILKTAKKMMEYTEHAARIRRVTAQNGHSSEFNLVERLPEIVERNSKVDGDVEICRELPEAAEVRANHMFLAAVEELIQNSVQHNDKDSPKVEVTVDPTGGALHHTEIRVSDNGPGIPDRVVNVLQESETDQLAHLQGMGLWFVYWVVAESDGHMVIDRNQGDGSLVRVRVPSTKVFQPKSRGQVLREG